MPQIKVLSAGAAQGLVDELSPRFGAITGYDVAATFGPVGAIAAKLQAGEAADVVILSAQSIADLARDTAVVGSSARDLGVVHAGIAVRTDDPAPALSDAEDLRAAILGSDAIYVPDPAQATAGIHFVAVLDQLGIKDEVWGRLQIFPSGVAAMTELAASKAKHPIGCTQNTEILHGPDVLLAGLLPAGFELATIYVAAVSAQAEDPEAAAKFVSFLAGDDAADIRARSGFTQA